MLLACMHAMNMVDAWGQKKVLSFPSVNLTEPSLMYVHVSVRVAVNETKNNNNKSCAPLNNNMENGDPKPREVLCLFCGRDSACGGECMHAC